MSSFQTYMSNAQSDPTVWLGELVWYSVTHTTRIPHADLVQRIEGQGLELYTPAEPREDDTFLRVTSAVERKREPVPNSDTFENFLVRKVSHSKGSVVKNIVVETVDSKNRRLDHESKVQLEFSSVNNGANGDFTVTPMGWPNHERAIKLAEEAQAAFAHWRGQAHADMLRTFINRVVVSANATLVKPTGGIYFVTQASTERLRQLERTVHDIAGVEVHTVPLVDTPAQRELVIQHFLTDTVAEVDRLTREMNAALAGEKISAERFNAYQRQIRELQAKTKEYEELLGVSAATADLHLQSLEKARGKLMWHTQ